MVQRLARYRNTENFAQSALHFEADVLPTPKGIMLTLSDPRGVHKPGTPDLSEDILLSRKEALRIAWGLFRAALRIRKEKRPNFSKKVKELT